VNVPAAPALAVHVDVRHVSMNANPVVAFAICICGVTAFVGAGSAMLAVVVDAAIQPVL
jgi:hypothetical protein